MDEKRYGAETLRLVNNAWRSYKSETKATQKTAAEALGMNQSALSQYLRGAVPLNTDFVTKFASLTKSEELKASNTAPIPLMRYSLPILYTSSGKHLQNVRMLVQAIITTEGLYGVENDLPRAEFQEGTILIVDPRSAVRAMDMAVLVKEDAPVVVGRVTNARGEWGLVRAVWGETLVHDLNGGETLHRVVGVYMPERQGKQFPN